MGLVAPGSRGTQLYPAERNRGASVPVSAAAPLRTPGPTKLTGVQHALPADGDRGLSRPVAWENAGVTSDDQEWLSCDEKMNVLPLEAEGPGAAQGLERGGRRYLACRAGSHAGQDWRS